MHATPGPETLAANSEYWVHTRAQIEHPYLDRLVSTFQGVELTRAIQAMTQPPPVKEEPSVGGGGKKRKMEGEAGVGGGAKKGGKKKGHIGDVIGGVGGEGKGGVDQPLESGVVFSVDLSREDILLMQILNKVIIGVEKGGVMSRSPSPQPLGKGGKPSGGKSKGNKASWACLWCSCTLTEGGGRAGGPTGPNTLCYPCSTRYRNGHLGPPTRDKDGMHECDTCTKKFESVRGLASHKRCCQDAAPPWRCQWCLSGEEGASGRCAGPMGAATLCSKCGERHAKGEEAPPLPEGWTGGKFVCTLCDKRFETAMGLGGHRRFCDGGQWKCGWCGVTSDESGGKAPGPDGPKALCSSCGNRYRSGHVGPAKKDGAGNFVCEDCSRRFETSAGLGGHRRFCSQLTKVRGEGDAKTIDDWDLEGVQAVGFAKLEGAESTTPARNAVEVWDMISFVVGEVLGEHLGLSWQSFCALLYNPRSLSVDQKAAIMLPMIELLYQELPSASPLLVFKGRPINRFTWLELLRQVNLLLMVSVYCSWFPVSSVQCPVSIV